MDDLIFAHYLLGNTPNSTYIQRNLPGAAQGLKSDICDCLVSVALVNNIARFWHALCRLVKPDTSVVLTFGVKFKLNFHLFGLLWLTACCYCVESLLRNATTHWIIEVWALNRSLPLSCCYNLYATTMRTRRHRIWTEIHKWFHQDCFHGVGLGCWANRFVSLSSLAHAVNCVRFCFWRCLWVFCLRMKYIRNRWTDLLQIHREDVFGHSLGRVWRSRSKVKVTRDKNGVFGRYLGNRWTDLPQFHMADVFGLPWSD